MNLDNKTFFKFGGLLAVIIILSLGCSHTVHVAPNPPLQTSAEKIPLDVGLYISEEFKNYQVSESKLGDKWNYPNLGAASASQFTLCLGQSFRSVQLVERLPPFPSEKEITVHAVIEPTIGKFEFDIPVTKFQVYRSRIRYIIKVYDIGGNIILEDVVEGIGDIQGHAGFDFTENPSKSASKAVEDGVQKVVEEIVDLEKIRRIQKE